MSVRVTVVTVVLLGAIVGMLVPEPTAAPAALSCGADHATTDRHLTRGVDTPNGCHLRETIDAILPVALGPSFAIFDLAGLTWEPTGVGLVGDTDGSPMGSGPQQAAAASEPSSLLVLAIGLLAFGTLVRVLHRERRRSK